jgi:hypothetical protein
MPLLALLAGSHQLDCNVNNLINIAIRMKAATYNLKFERRGIGLIRCCCMEDRRLYLLAKSPMGWLRSLSEGLL